MSQVEASKLGRPSVPALGEVLDFMRLIWEVDHALQRTSKRMEAALGVTGPQRFVIRIVGRFPGIPAGQLAEILHVHPSTLTGILKRLERRGLIRRRQDARDRRRTLLGLTDKGRSIDVGARGTVEAAVQRALERSTPQQAKATRVLLSTVVEMLDGSESTGGELSVPARQKRATRSSRQ